MSKIAVIIPAYKSQYLKICLDSFCKQTNPNFHLYIFNDNSPHEIDDKVSPYLSETNITYHKFEENLGGISLVQHWERCIALTAEPWIWMFSDDDISSLDCIEALQNAIHQHPGQPIFRFRKTIIDSKGKTTNKEEFPEFENSTEFFKSVTLKKYSLSAPEYVFSREVYLKNKGYVTFDLAWGSDIATWLVFAREQGIRTIEANIYYRMSETNISSINNFTIFKRKLFARFELLEWFEKQKDLYFEYKGKPSSYYVKDNVLYFIYTQISIIPTSEFPKLASEIKKNLRMKYLKALYFLIKSKLTQR
ncbi:MAG: glycosyltransferase family 2 protein [Reichenbachiella sp.]|uniref:glycosyltransferase family 2 protein n=1 Tax=Reichenbachiella sp. TaxID=2184521 RepID=UPI003299AC17